MWRSLQWPNQQTSGEEDQKAQSLLPSHQLHEISDRQRQECTHPAKHGRENGQAKEDIYPSHLWS